MKDITCVSAVKSLTYAQVCTRPNISYVIEKLGRYLCNLGTDHWKAAKKIMWYLQRTKDCMLTYRRYDQLQLIGCTYSDFIECIDSRKSTSGYVLLMAGETVS